MSTSTGEAAGDLLGSPGPRLVSATFFGTVRTIDGLHLMVIPDEIMSAQGLRHGETVAVRVENLAIVA